MAEWISVGEASELAGCLRQNIAYHIRKKNIIAHKSGRIWLVDRGSLLEYFRRENGETGRERDDSSASEDNEYKRSEKEEQHKEFLEFVYSWVSSASDRARLIAIHEDQDRLPYAELSREKFGLIQHSLENLAVLYYNLDISDTEQIDHFLESDYQQWARFGIWGDVSEQIKEIYRDFIRADQPKYRVIIDKIIGGDKLSREELDHIQDRTSGFLDQVGPHNGRWMIGRQYGIYRVHRVYEWAISLSQLPSKRDRVGICALDGCGRMFIWDSGKPQKYCSNAHRMRAHRQRKRAMATL